MTTKIVLITGASSGIGAVAAEYLAAKGYSIVLVARREERLSALSDKINRNHGCASYFACDLADEKSRLALVEKLKENKLLPDILINNAGFGWYGHYETMNWDSAKDLIAVNIEAVAHLTHLILPSMLRKKNGHIINIGSVVGKLPEQGVALYSASKSFLDAFTTSIFRELKGSGVNASIMRLGPVKTEFFDAARSHENGGNVPAEKFAISAMSVAQALYRLILRPQKVVYVPWYLLLSPLLEILFSWLLDLIGPLLLGKKQIPR